MWLFVELVEFGGLFYKGYDVGGGWVECVVEVGYFVVYVCFNGVYVLFGWLVVGGKVFFECVYVLFKL